MDPYLPRGVNSVDAALVLGISSSTLAKLRHFGRGPAYCKIGRRVVYRLADLQDWLDARERIPAGLAASESAPRLNSPLR